MYSSIYTQYTLLRNTSSKRHGNDEGHVPWSKWTKPLGGLKTVPSGIVHLDHCSRPFISKFIEFI